ncbi:hypothetical protein ABZV67_10660 [Streptomyces sp. NPDC005065]|uniref:hypothetical protein n=1 Tax=Streptomyces sp. NPDC005065 TaxID=3154461 RepID=UPI0033BD6846
MTELRPADHPFTESFAYALPLVLEHASDGGYVPMGEIFGAIDTRLRAEGMPTIPFGTVHRLLDATGLRVHQTCPPGADKQFKHVRNVRLLTTTK